MTITHPKTVANRDRHVRVPKWGITQLQLNKVVNGDCATWIIAHPTNTESHMRFNTLVTRTVSFTTATVSSTSNSVTILLAKIVALEEPKSRDRPPSILHYTKHPLQIHLGLAEPKRSAYGIQPHDENQIANPNTNTKSRKLQASTKKSKLHFATLVSHLKR